MREHVLKLATGVSIGLVEYGDPDGAPVAFFHGHPGSHVNAEFLAPEAELLGRGLRLLAFDRPGMGLTPNLRGLAIADWPALVQAALGRLGIERFAVASHSAGAPYALACSIALPQLVRGVVLISPIGRPERWDLAQSQMPDTRAYFEQMRRDSFMAPLTLGMMRLFVMTFPNLLLGQMVPRLPVPDAAAMQNPQHAAIFLRMLQVCFGGGITGTRRDAERVIRPWGLDLTTAQPGIVAFHGDADGNVPLPWARELVEHLPQATLTVLPGGGHVSLLANHRDELLRQLEAAARR